MSILTKQYIDLILHLKKPNFGNGFVSEVIRNIVIESPGELIQDDIGTF